MNTENPCCEMSKYHLSVLGCEDVTALHWKQLPNIASGNAEVTHTRVDRNKGLLASTYTVQHCTNGSGNRGGPG